MVAGQEEEEAPSSNQTVVQGVEQPPAATPPGPVPVAVSGAESAESAGVAQQQAEPAPALLATTGEGEAPPPAAAEGGVTPTSTAVLTPTEGTPPGGTPPGTAAVAVPATVVAAIPAVTPKATAAATATAPPPLPAEAAPEAPGAAANKTAVAAAAAAAAPEKRAMSTSPCASPRILYGGRDFRARLLAPGLGAGGTLGGRRELPVRAGTGAGGETSLVKSPGLPRIQSEGGLTSIVEAKSGFAFKQRGLVAGRPSRERSGFVAADTVKRGLGPAGAFAGNSNWRVEASREKEKSAADVKGDGHGGFHNPMAALRAQQQQQRAQQQQARRVRTGSED
ncbi:unnamed protein product, partial [Ectocarpus sp. 12 AP-2014]